MRSSRLPGLLLASLVLAAGLALTGGANPPAAAAYPSPTVDLVGHGFGHGNGLGQYGALGYALEDGWSAARILDHYYGGTTAGTVPDDEITVRLVEQDGRDLVITSGSPFAIGSNAYVPGEAARIRRVGGSTGTWSVDRATGCAGPWTEAQAGISGSTTPEAATAYGGDDVNLMLRVCGTNVRSYRGRILAAFDGVARTVNAVRLEQYLRGVVPREMPASWGDLGGGKGQQALMAQAVAARSYAVAEARASFARTCDTQACQVYGGAGLNGERIEPRQTDAAVRATAGQVRRTAAGAVARTEFSSSTGGHSSGRGFPAVVDAGDDTPSNPNHTWRASIPVATVEAAYPSVGPLTSVTVSDRNGLGEDGGRVLIVRIVGTAGSASATGGSFRSSLGLKSDWFTIIPPALGAPVAGIAAVPGGGGYWLATANGGVVAAGTAAALGGVNGRPLNAPIVGIAATPTGQGYWLLGRDGGIFSFGDARFYGSTGGRRLNQPVVGIASTPTGAGYWLVASDGGIFAFGDARFYGSMGGRTLNQPVVGMAAYPKGEGYWLVARDGGIFSFGRAPFRGSTGAIRLNQPIVGMTASRVGDGYWFVAADGGVFAFGDALFFGSRGGAPGAPVTGLASTASGQGYWLSQSDGAVLDYGDARL